MLREKKCHSCGETFKENGIGKHWSNSNSCDYPQLQTDKKGAIVGLWLIGGSKRGNRDKPALEKVSTNRRGLESIDNLLGFWGSGTETIPRDSPIYRVSLRKHPYIGRLNLDNLDTLEFTSETAKILYSFKGSITDETRVKLFHDNPGILAQFLFNNGFSDIWCISEDNPHIILSDSDSWKLLNSFDGEPLVGCEERVPSVTCTEDGRIVINSSTSNTVLTGTVGSGSKTHIFEKVGNDLYKPVCNVSGHFNGPFSLSETRPNEFLNRSDSCKTCGKNVDTPDEVSTEPAIENVDYDPFGVKN